MNAAEGSGDVFEIKQLRRLIELMKKHDLSEVDLEQGDARVRIRRGGAAAQPFVLPAQPAAGVPAEPAAPAAKPPADSQHTVITSPMVGTFYRASGPEASPFVKVGDRIDPESTVCIIEAMKVFNEIPAGVAGQVVAVLVENGAAVEFGQPLVKVDPGA
jgi:acetyl-CoA carboxylase biotin carboxyl carrier protein